MNGASRTDEPPSSGAYSRRLLNSLRQTLTEAGIEVPSASLVNYDSAAETGLPTDSKFRLADTEGRWSVDIYDDEVVCWCAGNETSFDPEDWPEATALAQAIAAAIRGA